MQTLVSLELVLGLEVWLALSVLASQPSMSANCLLVLLLQWSFDYKQVEKVGLLAVKLVIRLVAGAFSQLGLLSVGIILGLETGKASWPGWIVLEGDFGDKWLLWWIHLEYHRAFGR